MSITYMNSRIFHYISTAQSELKGEKEWGEKGSQSWNSGLHEGVRGIKSGLCLLFSSVRERSVKDVSH